MEKITYRNAKGGMIQLRYSAPYVLQNFSGAGDLSFDVQSVKAPFQDGETFLDTLAGTRDLFFKIALLGSSQADLYERRRHLSRVFNPKLGKGVLTYENDFLERSIEVYLESGPKFPIGTSRRGSRFQACLIQLTATEPFWTDAKDRGALLQNVAPLFQFDLEIPEEEGIEMSSHAEGRIVINNSGDVETPLHFEFAGPVTDPRITNATTGEFIELITPLLAGERMTITTGFGNKKALIRDENNNVQNAFQCLNLDSAFFQLQPGENVLEFDAAAGSAEAEITIKYRRRFIGV